MPNKINIGQKIKEKKEQLGLKTTELANKTNIDKRQAYRIYKKKSIDTDVLYDLSIQLNYDFFKLYSEELANKIASVTKESLWHYCHADALSLESI